MAQMDCFLHSVDPMLDCGKQIDILVIRQPHPLALWFKATFFGDFCSIVVPSGSSLSASGLQNGTLRCRHRQYKYLDETKGTAYVYRHHPLPSVPARPEKHAY